MNQIKRKIVVVDEELQRGLAKRIVMYWCLTWLMVFTLPILVRMMSGQMPFEQLARSIVADFWFPIAISVFLIPIVVWDSLRFSNRVAGPVFRIGRTIGEMTEGQNVRSVNLRPGDFCGELAGNVNRLMDQRSSENNAGDPEQESELLETVV